VLFGATAHSPTHDAAAARDLGLRADPTPLWFVQVGIDAVDIPNVREFWRAVLGDELDVAGVVDARRPEGNEVDIAVGRGALATRHDA
jgi:hypothetical protein